MCHNDHNQIVISCVAAVATVTRHTKLSLEVLLYHYDKTGLIYMFQYC